MYIHIYGTASLTGKEIVFTQGVCSLCPEPLKSPKASLLRLLFVGSRPQMKITAYLDWDAIS